MYRVGLGVIASLSLLGCISSEPAEPAESSESQPLAEAEAPSADAQRAVTPLVTEQIVWRCPTPPAQLFLTQEACEASCSTSCFELLICFDRFGRQVICP